jgi:hypothetical protein
VWLNWELFEVALASSLLPRGISLDTIQEAASLYADLTQLVSFDDWKDRIAASQIRLGYLS